MSWQLSDDDAHQALRMTEDKDETGFATFGRYSRDSASTREGVTLSSATFNFHGAVDTCQALKASELFEQQRFMAACGEVVERPGEHSWEILSWPWPLYALNLQLNSNTTI